MKREILVSDENAMVQLGIDLSQLLLPGQQIFLQGELGAGKTTLVRGILRGLGYQGIVKSPTYSLMEIYEFPEFQVVHCDFYRLRDPEELADIGLSDYLSKSAIHLIEWSENAGKRLLNPTLWCEIKEVAEGRRLIFTAGSEPGIAILQALEKNS